MPLSFLFACSTGWLFPCLQLGLFPCLQRGLFPCPLPDGAPFRQVAFLAGASCRTRFPLSSTAPPASSIFPMALCHSAAILFAMTLQASSIFPMALHCSVPASSPLCRWFPACNSFATAPLPATNLIRQRSTPVWLAIWRTWAGFANSQHRDAAFATPDNICAHSSLLPH